MSEIIDALKSIAPPLGWASVGSLITWIVLHRLDLGKGRVLARESDIRHERAEFVPIIKQAILDCGSGNQPLYAWRHHAKNLNSGAMRFSTFLEGRRKRAFDAAWQECSQTKDAELLDSRGNWFADGDAGLKTAQAVIAARLQAVLDCVERA